MTDLSKTGLTRKRATGSKSIKDVQKTERGLSARTATQNKLREQLEGSAEDIISLMTSVILTGYLEDDKVSNGMRLDLMKAYMPYVVPTLKSVEYVDQRPKDLQPLIINMHGGTASIDTDGEGNTKIELDSTDNNGIKEVRDIREDFINADIDRTPSAGELIAEAESLQHKSKFDNLISHKTEQGELNGDPEVPQVIMKQTNEGEAVVFETEGDLATILKQNTSLEARNKAKKEKSRISHKTTRAELNQINKTKEK